jgi:hypothetical protein
LKKTVSLWSDGARILVEGTVSDKDGQLKILATSAWTLTRDTLAELPPLQTQRRRPERALSSAHELHIRLAASLSKEQLVQLRHVLAAHSAGEADGGLPVTLLTRGSSGETKVPTPFRLRRQAQAQAAVAEIVGSSALLFR